VVRDENGGAGCGQISEKLKVASRFGRVLLAAGMEGYKRVEDDHRFVLTSKTNDFQ
jgi:hypothetical protein